MKRTMVRACDLILNFFILLLLSNVTLSKVARFSNVYTVSSPSNLCSEGIRNCHELSFYVRDSSKYFVSNVKFNFLSGRHTLNSTLHPILITNMGNTMFEGSSNDLPIIHCIEGTYGFYFENSTNVTISSLVFEGCGPTIHSSALTVIQGSVWRFINITISNTAGIGLILRNVDSFEMTGSKFFSNGLGIWNCSLVTYQWGFSVSVISTSIDKVINYTIRDTVFRGNTPSGQLGGGLHMDIINPSSVFVEVRHSTFDGISGCLSTGANITIDGYSVRFNVTVMESIFVNNYRHDIPNYEIHKELDGGGLKIKVSKKQSSADFVNCTACQIFVSSSIFLNNRAPYCAAAAILTSSVINLKVDIVNVTVIGNVGSKRGGGVCVSPVGSIQSSRKHYQLKISDSIFQNNMGANGAALQVWPVFVGGFMAFNVTIENCDFKSNNVNCSLEFNCKSWRSIFIRLAHHKKAKFKNDNEVFITLKKCRIIENMYGSALYIESYDTIVAFSFNVHIAIAQCVITKNSNGGVFVSMLRSSNFNMLIQNSNFSGQTGRNDLLHIQCPGPLSIVNIADTRLFNNVGSSISIVDCALNFKGYNVIENNTADVGAAIHVAGSGYVFTALNSTLVLRNNTAIFGGALYSKTKEIKLSGYSICTFLSLENANFSNNRASIAGDNMYGGLAKVCSKVTGMSIRGIGNRYTPPYFKCPQTRHGMFQTASSVSSDPYSVLLCDESQKMSRNVTVKKYPGQSINLMVTTAGYCDGFSPGFLNMSTQSKELQIMQDVQSQEIDSRCKKISFRVLLLHNITSVSVLLDIAHSTLDLTQPSTVNVTFLPCPHGMYLGDTKECQCTSTIANYVDQCNVSWIPNPLRKIVSQNNWLDYDENRKCITIASICPFDYCSTDHSDVNFNLDNNTDLQCSNNRTGILCGQCKPGLSLILGSNACKRCFNKNLLLVIVFFVAGLFLVAFIASLNMTISNGMLNGLLFYVNIVKLNETRLFPNGSIPVISQFISWLNLDLGIEVCLFNGLDAYWKTWLQFAFPLYVWLVTIGIILYSRYSVRFSQYLPTNIISVLATLILISFTKLLRNLTSVFMATGVHCDDQSQLVWSTDGNIDYWSTKHSILMGFAAIFLVFVACYTFLLIFFQCLQRVSNYKVCFCLQRVWFRISPFIDAYTGPFVPKYYYWAGILVFIRIIVTVSFAYTSGAVEYINNYIIVIIEICIFNIFNSDIYQSKVNYICERFFHVNLCVLCIVNSIYHMNSTFITMATITSVSLSLIAFIVVVGWHIYRLIQKKFVKTQHKQEIQPLLRPEGQDSHQSDNYSPSRIVRRRDSIIFEF